MEKDWEDRFQNQSGAFTQFRRTFTKGSVIAAGCYWLFVITLFVVLVASGSDTTGTGALPLVWATIPSSLLMIAVTSSMPTAQINSLSSATGTFLIPLLCGGLNAVAIAAVWSFAEKRAARQK